jgi:pimeloyl-ACP methyl ester carboxylesterase
MAYDATRRALYHPECDKPADMRGWSLDQRCAEFSRLAYVQFEHGKEYKDIIKASLAQIGFSKVEFFQNDRLDAQGFGAVDEARNVIIAFRGTQADQFQDLISDIRIWPQKAKGPGRIHKGFYEAVEVLRKQIDPWLPHDRASLVITGHSLGGAMATVLAASFKDAELVTFGSPRVGTAAFAAGLGQQKIRRYVDCLDLVTGVPPAFMFFRHAGDMIYIDRRGFVHPTPPSWLKRTGDQVIAFVAYLPKAFGWGNVLIRNLADHAPANYVSALRGTR